MQIIKRKLRSQIDERGELTFAEENIDIPFVTKRVYFLRNLKSDFERGFHAHKVLKQVIYCVSGSFMLLLDDGKESKTIELLAGETVFIDSVVWHVMSHFSKDCVIAVFASDFYKESDYIRDYTEYKNHLTKGL